MLILKVHMKENPNLPYKLFITIIINQRNRIIAIISPSVLNFQKASLIIFHFNRKFLRKKS